MSGWLASVTTAEEALQALAAGAHIIDAKNPQAGALGALDAITIKSIVEAVAGRVPVSATIGDFPDMDPDAVAQAVAATAATGVDYVKIGLFPGPGVPGCLASLAPWAYRQPLVAVLFADLDPDFGILSRLASSGFSGAMLDTAHKDAGGLLTHQPLARLTAFIGQCHDLGMLSGLAGSLSRTDIPRLRPLAPDYLGFRGALCESSTRTRAISPRALSEVAQLMSAAPVADAAVI